MSTTLHSANTIWNMYADYTHPNEEMLQEKEQEIQPPGSDDEDDPCCIIQIAVPRGTPLLPLADYPMDHVHENEVLLPPGLELEFSHAGMVNTDRMVVERHNFIVTGAVPASLLDSAQRE
jgi:hypothetical protein